jgi:hypothetical protein
MFKIISPTGMPVRGADRWGSGAFGAPRNGRDHKGADFVCRPGQDVVAPCYCRVEREARPYPDERYSGILLEEINKLFLAMIFYLAPHPEMLLKGRILSPGDPIGFAQDITKRNLPDKYPGMAPHIHVEILLRPDLLRPRPAAVPRIDPESLL